MRRSHRRQAAWCLAGFVAWAALGLGVAIMMPLPNGELPRRLAIVALFGGLPLVMAGCSLWMMLAYRREELSIRDGRVVARGLTRVDEIELSGLTSARWRLRPFGGSVILQGASARVAISFDKYEVDEGNRIIEYLRSAVHAGLQSDWNLFAYRLPYPRLLEVRRKPGPDEVLLTRRRWDRYFLPVFAVLAPAAIVAWWFTREARFLTGLVPLLFPWALLRFMTPAEGIVDRRLTSPADRHKLGFLWFLLAWGLVGIAGVAASEAFGARLGHLNAVRIVGGVIWVAVLLFEAGLQDRRQSRRDREAADLAAKDRGETTADPWLT